jgi:hypothetical protein
MKKDSGLARLPGIAFATIVTTGMTIAICLGDSRWYTVETNKTADELNSLYGVTPSQARAVLATMLRSYLPSRADSRQVDASDRLATTSDRQSRSGTPS